VESVNDDTPDEQSIFSIESFEDSDSCCAVHMDGCFHVEDIQVLMSLYNDVGVVSEMDFYSENSIAEKGSEVVIVFSHYGRCNFPVENVVREDGVGLKLQFVSGREFSKNDSSDFAFMQHGEGALTNWWVQR